jgi:hypothetical protein
MIFVSKTKRIADLLDAEGGFGQQVLGDSDSAVQKVLVGGHIKIFFELAAYLRFGQVHLLAELFHCHLAVYGLVQNFLYLNCGGGDIGLFAVGDKVQNYLKNYLRNLQVNILVVAVNFG